MNYDWKNYSVSITLDAGAINLHRGRWLDALDKQMELTEKVAMCHLSHPFTVDYKRYRRGKNRCKYCGVKLVWAGFAHGWIYS